MKRRAILTATILILITMNNASAQPNIIFDTDFGGDADDLGALTMLHHYVDQGACDLLGVMSWSTELYTVPAIDAVNRFYDHPEIPIGVRKDGPSHLEWQYSKSIVEKQPHLQSYYDVPDATRLYRKILAQQPDSSVTIVTVGPLMNIQNLIQSQPDEYSDLHGLDLLHKKVKRFVIMGGKFPEGDDEWNFDGNMRGVTQFVLEHLQMSVVFSGYEIGVRVQTGEVFNQLDPSHPLYAGFKHFSEHAPWMKERYEGRILDNASYDQTAVLYAVKDRTGTYWEKVEGGYCEVEPDGDNKWIERGGTNQSYLRLIADPEEVAAEIEAAMLGKN